MSNAPELTTAAIKMVFALGIVLMVVWGLYRLAQKKIPIPGGVGTVTSRIQVVDNRYIGAKKSIAMVKVPGSVLVLGIGAEEIRLLTQITDPDLLKEIDSDQKKQRSMSFKDQLQRFTQPQRKSRTKPQNETSAV